MTLFTATDRFTNMHEYVIHNSSAIAAIIFAPNLCEITVQFTSGSTYMYHIGNDGLVNALERSFVACDSVGKWFHNFVKPLASEVVKCNHNII